MSKNILVVDDDKELCNLLKQCLGNEGYDVNCLYDGKNVISYIKQNQTNLVILDVMLPQIDGFTVLKQIRELSNILILMLSAKGDEMNKVLGLRTGADDYLAKPFGLSELIARVESLFRRCAFTQQVEKEDKHTILTFQNLSIDTDRCIVTRNNELIALTSKEYKLLVFLANNPMKVFTKKQIYNEVWEDDFVYDDNTIMALISRLRKKIELNPNEPQHIQTVWGIGYRFYNEGK